MTEGSEQLTSLVKNPIGALQVEDLLMDALRDLVRDEIKRYIRKKLEENPELKAEIREAIVELMEAKMLEAYAVLRLGKCGAELGMTMVPDDLKNRLNKDLASLLEREMSEVMNKID